jgi:hypothetical protein
VHPYGHAAIGHLLHLLRVDGGAKLSELPCPVAADTVAATHVTALHAVRPNDILTTSARS